MPTTGLTVLREDDETKVPIMQPPALRQWLPVAAKQIELIEDRPDDVSQPQEDIDGWPIGVWVTNGQTGNAWEGAQIARCPDLVHAELLAEALWELVKAVQSGDL